EIEIAFYVHRAGRGSIGRRAVTILFQHRPGIQSIPPDLYLNTSEIFSDRVLQRHQNAHAQQMRTDCNGDRGIGRRQIALDVRRPDDSGNCILDAGCRYRSESEIDESRPRSLPVHFPVGAIDVYQSDVVQPTVVRHLDAKAAELSELARLDKRQGVGRCRYSKRNVGQSVRTKIIADRSRLPGTRSGDEVYVRSVEVVVSVRFDCR